MDFLKKYNLKLVNFLEPISRLIAFFVCLELLLLSMVTTVKAFNDLFEQNLDLAVQDGLFVLILLEMFYVTRSFIKYGTINVSIVINVGLIAAVKEMIFQLHSMTMQLAIGFAVLFISLSVTYYLEKIHFKEVVSAKKA